LDDVHALVVHHDLTTAERLVSAVRPKATANAELAAAISWLARGSLEARQFSKADAYATESRDIALRSLGARKLDSDPWLPMALGASIEVHAGALAAQGQRAEAVTFLQDQLKAWGGTSLRERIQKNINLLSLEGKPAPPLEGINVASLKGRPVLLFFWAHWCPDCKADVPVMANAVKRFGPRGLALIGPTKLYGYVEGGEPAPPAAEKKYIEQVRQRYYAPLANMPAPLSAANFAAYGASTTPTIVLIDRSGIVRFYHPGAVTEQELAARVEPLLR
jgi:thiol-disulfide isomerase/thioredoxin